MLGLPYPGGRELDRLAAAGDDRYVRFPRALPRGLDFSFSGLKTALLYYVREQSEADVAERRADIAASYQGAIVRQLVDKAVRCAEGEGVRDLAVAGGVAANSGLREALRRECDRRGLTVHLPPLSLCTDNAAMVGLAAARLPAVAWPDYLGLDAYAAAAAAERREGSRSVAGPPRDLWLGRNGRGRPSAAAPGRRPPRRSRSLAGETPPAVGRRGAEILLPFGGDGQASSISGARPG